VESNLVTFVLGAELQLEVVRYHHDLELGGAAQVDLSPQTETFLTVTGRERLNEISVRMSHPGMRPVLVSMGLEATLPIAVVDEPNWIPLLEIKRVDYGPEYPQARAVVATTQATTMNGTALYGETGCAFESFVGDASTRESSEDACSIQGGPGSTLFRADRVCVQAHGKTSCAAVPPLGQ
jgi:hypothetical protein